MDNCHGDTSGLPTRQPPGSAVREAAQEPCSPRSGTTPSRAGITSYQAVALERARTQLTRCLDRASRSQWVETSECRWLRSSFAEKTFRILFVGQSRQRTAAVINALLGERVLPSPLYARDATVSVVRYGPNPAARLEPPENRVFAVSSESQREAVVQSATRTRRVIIERPSPWLAGGLELLHTPPVGSLWEYNRHVAHRYLASVDAIVFVSSTQRPLSRLESEFLSDLVPYGEKAFFVLDEPAPPRPGQDRSTVARAKRIRLAIDPRIPIFAVSAGRSLAGKLDCKIGLPPDPTFAAFEHELRHFLDTRRRDTWLQPFARSLSRILSHARARLNLERSALTSSDDEMARWSAALDLGKERLHDALRTAEEWLCEGAGALLRSEVDAAVESFADRERRRRKNCARRFARLTLDGSYGRSEPSPGRSTRCVPGFGARCKAQSTRSCVMPANCMPSDRRIPARLMWTNRYSDTASGLIPRPFVCDGCCAIPRSHGWLAVLGKRATSAKALSIRSKCTRAESVGISSGARGRAWKTSAPMRRSGSSRQPRGSWRPLNARLNCAGRRRSNALRAARNWPMAAQRFFACKPECTRFLRHLWTHRYGE